LETENVAPGKVVLLEGQAFAAELQRFSPSMFPRVKFENLFMEKKIDAGKKYAQVAADGVLQMTRKAPASPPKASPVVPKKLVEPDPYVAMSVKNLSPRACNMFYLNADKCGKYDCQYSHDHVLTPEQLAALRFLIKRQPCATFMKGHECPFNDECMYGHDCPDNIGGQCGNKKCKLSHPVAGDYV